MKKELIRIAKALEGIEKELHQLNKKMEPKGQNIEELSLAVENRLLHSLETSPGHGYIETRFEIPEVDGSGMCTIPLRT